MSSKKKQRKVTKKVKALEVNEVAMSCRYCPYGKEKSLTPCEAIVNGVMVRLGHPTPSASPRWWCNAKHCQVDPDKPRFCAIRTSLMQKSRFKIVDLTNSILCRSPS
jgi:hypothetical protein